MQLPLHCAASLVSKLKDHGIAMVCITARIQRTPWLKLFPAMAMCLVIDMLTRLVMLQCQCGASIAGKLALLLNKQRAARHASLHMTCTVEDTAA